MTPEQTCTALHKAHIGAVKSANGAHIVEESRTKKRQSTLKQTWYSSSKTRESCLAISSSLCTNASVECGAHRRARALLNCRQPVRAPARVALYSNRTSTWSAFQFQTTVEA